MTRPSDNEQKKKKKEKKKNNCWMVDSGVPPDHKVKLKEIKKRHKYLDLARELKQKTNYGTWKFRRYQL